MLRRVADPETAERIRQLEQTIAELQERQQFLLELHGATDAMVEPSEIVKTIARMLAQHLRVERCLYASIEENRLIEVIGEWTIGVPSASGRSGLERFGEARVRALVDNHPFVIEDVTTDPRLDENDRAAYRSLAIVSAITVPLHKHRALVAAMAVHHASPRKWTRSEIELISVVVARCWETLERAAVERERRVVERDLLESRNRLEYAVRLSGIGFWYCDLPFSELLWDDRVKAHFFLPLDTRVTMDLFYERIHPDDREPTRRAINTSIEEHATYDVVYRTVDPDTGAIHHIRALGGTAYDAWDNPIRFDGVTLDVSELLENDRRKDEFLAVLAHELRNPLAPVRSGIEVIAHGAAPDEVARISSMMRRQIDHVVRIVDDLLEASRVTLGKLVLVKTRIDIREAIESALDVTRGMFEEKSIRLVVDMPAFPISVQVDATRISQAFANLLSNAAKFSYRDGIVRIKVRVDEPFRVQVIIIDEGVGIPADRLDSIFVMFTQLDLDPGRTRGGLGIGLALTKRLVELHGGRIVTASKGAGTGSTFIVELPLSARAELVKPSSPPLPTASSSLRILVVDDNIDAAEMLAMLLEAKGHVVERAFNGRDGLAAASAFRPDAVLLDLGLPDMEGHEVGRQLRKTEGARRMMIVAVTGWGDEVHRRATKEAGFDEHIVKPIDRDRLFRTLERLAGASYP